jgi:hypothetical protein
VVEHLTPSAERLPDRHLAAGPGLGRAEYIPLTVCSVLASMIDRLLRRRHASATWPLRGMVAEAAANDLLGGRAGTLLRAVEIAPEGEPARRPFGHRPGRRLGALRRASSA